ncbi:hypothetical protein [Pelagibacterium luteolum]|uniref:Uncharacterized protein n=1 Tax=Pelagibacterium luteolum TaxID=440168 RepID=A0A1G7RZ18_9HYPH|nr:hypothetical protein [Pelagibacterium luteolum]SDG16012.1 hypothetical protein SAMN04487974_101211 [Pelagibacterium luteolum]
MSEGVAPGFVAIWNGVTPGTENDFAAWHKKEHMPERLAIPGFLRGTRWGERTYFTLYELAHPDVARSAHYLERLNAPTDWTRRVMSHFQDNSRCVGAFVHSLGAMPHERAIIIRLDGEQQGTIDDAVAVEIMNIAGVKGCHIGLADNAVSSIKTIERQGRHVHEPWGLILIALDADADPAPIEASVGRHLPKAAPEILDLTLQLQMSRVYEIV